MKVVLFITAFFLLLTLFISCSSEINNTKTEKNLVGKWKPVPIGDKQILDDSIIEFKDNHSFVSHQIGNMPNRYWAVADRRDESGNLTQYIVFDLGNQEYSTVKIKHIDNTHLNI